MRKKLLLVGWDSADWKIIHPLFVALPRGSALVRHGRDGAPPPSQVSGAQRRLRGAGESQTRAAPPQIWDPGGAASLPFIFERRCRAAHTVGAPLRSKWRDDLCLARTLLAAPFGPSSMCFLGTARCLGCVVPNLSRKAASSGWQNHGQQNHLSGACAAS